MKTHSQRLTFYTSHLAQKLRKLWLIASHNFTRGRQKKKKNKRPSNLWFSTCNHGNSTFLDCCNFIWVWMDRSCSVRYGGISHFFFFIRMYDSSGIWFSLCVPLFFLKSRSKNCDWLEKVWIHGSRISYQLMRRAFEFWQTIILGEISKFRTM